MKKKILIFLALILILLSVTTSNKPVFASSSKEFRVDQHMITKFQKSQGNLIVEVEDSFYNQSWEKINKKNISYKISKKCKWLKRNFDNVVSGRGSKYYKSSYSKIKKEIKAQRKQYLTQLDGYIYDSPVGMSIIVKNKKIIKVVVLM